MERNIKKSIRTGVVVLAGLLMNYACSDTWDDHYNGNLAEGSVVDATIYQQLTSKPELSDFLEIIDATGYRALLDESQIVTVFAPVNGSFNKDSLLNEINSGNKNMVILRFVKNHIARYNYSSNSEKQDILLLNKKQTSLVNGVVGVDSIKAKSVNTVCNNGILHVVNGEIKFHPNIYELMELDADIDSLHAILSEYDNDSLDVNRSVYRGVDEDGNRIYVDSVIINTNRLMQRLDAYVHREDSNYIVIAPTNKAYHQRYDETWNYFKFNVHELDRDSLQHYYANYFTLNTLLFNRNTNVRAQDSIMTTTYSRWDPKHNVFYTPYKEGGILSPSNYKDVVTCSNGLVYKTDSFPTSIYDAFFHEIKLEAESTGNINLDIDPQNGNVNYTKNCSYTYRSDNIHRLSGRAYLDVIPSNSSSNPLIAFNIPNTLSGAYDMYIVTVPLRYARGVADEDTLKGYKFRVNMFYRSNKLSDSNSEWPKTRSEVLKTPANEKSNDFESNPLEMDTIFLGTKTFDACYYQTDKAGVMMQIQAYVSSKDVKTYSRRMMFDRILFRPHGMPVEEEKAKKEQPVTDPEDKE